MPVKVKICGITTDDALQAAIAAGADFIGLVFYPPSPRHVSPQRAAALARAARGRAGVVALTVNATDEELAVIRETVRPDYLQAHGDESPERVAAIRELMGCPVIRAFRLKGPEDLGQVAAFAPRIAFPLFDAWHPQDDADALPGGMGRRFDWSWLKDHSGDFMLAGGLTPENVAEAVRLTGAPMVDVSSGVEKARGVKDPERIARFIATAKNAAG